MVSVIRAAQYSIQGIVTRTSRVNFEHLNPQKNSLKEGARIKMIAHAFEEKLGDACSLQMVARDVFGDGVYLNSFQIGGGLGNWATYWQRSLSMIATKCR